MSKPKPIRVLYMEDDRTQALLVQIKLQQAGYEVDFASDREEVLAKYDPASYDLVAVDQSTPDCEGLEVIRLLASRGPLLPTVVVTDGGDEMVAVEALKLGATDYVVRDAQGRFVDLLPYVIEKALHQQRLLQERQQALEALRRSEEQLEEANARLHYLLTRFVPADLAQELVAEHELPSLGGQRRTVSVLFADVRGYTPLAEVLEPEALMGLLIRHFTVIGNSIRAHGGTVSQYTGDRMMAIFNAPQDQPDHALRAVRAGMDVRGALLELGRRSPDDDLPIVVQFGVGINSGPAVVGYLGFEDRFDYTAVGDAINTAARLSAAARGGEVLIGPETFEAVRGHIRTIMLGPMKLKGKSEPLVVYEAVGEMPPSDAVAASE